MLCALNAAGIAFSGYEIHKYLIPSFSGIVLSEKSSAYHDILPPIKLCIASIFKALRRYNTSGNGVLVT